MPMFSFNKCCHTVFKVVVHFPLSSHSHQCMKVPVASHPCQPLVWADFLILALLEHMMKFTVVLILISLMTNKVEHFFTCLLVIQISSFVIYLFFIGLFANFLCCRSSLFILDMRTVLDICISNIFFQFMGFLSFS